MLLATRPLSPASQSDAEFEWMLCVASALQACQQQPAKFPVKRAKPRGMIFVNRPRTALKTQRRAERNPAA
jgi:hypothetical protein